MLIPSSLGPRTLPLPGLRSIFGDLKPNPWGSNQGSSCLDFSDTTKMLNFPYWKGSEGPDFPKALGLAVGGQCGAVAQRAEGLVKTLALPFGPEGWDS